MTPDDVLAGLDPEQREAVLAPPGPVCILAGAGTGKTRTITHRIAYGVLTGRAHPGHVLALTFTSRAAGELRTRLHALGAPGVQARTFHAAALRQLGYFWPRLVGGDFPSLADNRYPLVANAAARAGLRASQTEIRDLVGEIEWAKARGVAPDGYTRAAAADRRTPPRDAAEVAAVYTAYEALKRRAGRLDFDDLLLLLAAALEEHDDVAGEVRARYRHLVVDEYQDVSPVQQRLLDAWLGDRDDLCVVGDDDQTIYSFAGACRDHLVGFARRYAGAAVIRLVRDYRSTPQVVGLANAVIAGSGSGKRLLAQRPDGPPPVFREHDSEPAEARWVAERVRALFDLGVPAREIAVLYRLNAQSEVYEAAFEAADVPYVVRGGERFFDRAEVREGIAALRAAVRTSASGSETGALPELVRAVLGERLGWDPEAPPAGGAARERWEALSALAGLAAEPGAGAELGEFVADLERRAADRHVPVVDGVTLASLHAAKGLEWDAVFVVGLVEGTLPTQHATDAAALAEERRLLYVGITRARVHLHLSWALARAEGGRRTRRRSRFLDGIAPAVAVTTGRPASGGRAERPAAAAALGPAEREVFERLREWRRARAWALGQPAYCVFPDATLSAIAAARPRDLAALAGVPGVGPTKLDRFGAEVLELTAAG